jgi:hypothetical protein
MSSIDQKQIKVHIPALNCKLEMLPNTNLKFIFKEKDTDFPQGFDFELNKDGVIDLVKNLNGYLSKFKFKVVKVVGGGNQEEWYTRNLGEMGTFTTREEAEKWIKEHKDELVYKEGDIYSMGASHNERFEIREE